MLLADARFTSGSFDPTPCARLAENGIDSVVRAKDIGYELRCAKPVPFDVDYTRTLGFGAVCYLVDGGRGVLLALNGSNVRSLMLNDLLDPQTGRIHTRQVDLATEAYRAARDYILSHRIFSEYAKLAALAANSADESTRGGLSRAVRVDGACLSASAAGRTRTSARYGVNSKTVPQPELPQDPEPPALVVP
jgi:hypothetical protein